MSFTPFDFNNDGKLDSIEKGALYNYIKNRNKSVFGANSTANNFNKNHGSHILTEKQYEEQIKRQEKSKRATKAKVIFFSLLFFASILMFVVMTLCQKYLDPLEAVDNLIFLLLLVIILVSYLSLLILGAKYTAQIEYEGYTLKQFLKKTFHIGKEK